MSSASSIGDQVIKSVAAMFAAEDTLKLNPSGLEWGVPGGKQKLWYENSREGSDGQPELVRIRILTEVAAMTGKPDEWPEDVLGLIFPLSECAIWGSILTPDIETEPLSIGSAVTAHEGNVGYLPRVLFRSMAAQAALREIMHRSDLKEFIAERATGGGVDDMAELAESFTMLLSQSSEGIPDGVSDDLGFLTEQFQSFPCLMCSGDEKGLSAEFPYGKETSLLRIETEVEHPLFSTDAICLTLILPLDAVETPNMMANIMEMNRREQSDLDLSWSLGSWMISRQGGLRLAYRIWMPNSMFQKNMLINLGLGMVARARRCCKNMANMTFEDAYPAAQEQMNQRMEMILKMLGSGKSPLPERS
jgi:hypothetical protein